MYLCIYVFMYEDAYAAEASKFKPLIHTWTLGVEWQFYLAFPLVIYAIKRFCPEYLEQLLVLFFALSFIYCAFLMQHNSAHAFYSTPARVWELLFGSVVFLISRRLAAHWLDPYLAALGFSLVIYAFIFMRDAEGHPGFLSFFAIVGVALVILFNRDGTFLCNVLVSKVFVFFGVISYSLYLYHQPVMAFYRIGYGDFGWSAFGGLFLLCVALAYLSYRLFEDPMRRSRGNLKYVFLFFLILVVVSFCYFAIKTQGFNNRFEVDNKNLAKHFEVKEWVRLQGDLPGKNFKGNKISSCNLRLPETACVFHGGVDSKKLIVVGDSYSGVFTYVLRQRYPDLSMVAYHYAGCPLHVAPIVANKIYKECWEINQQRWRFLASHAPSSVLVGTNFELFDKSHTVDDDFKLSKEPASQEYVFDSFRASIEKLLELGHRPIVLLNPPVTQKDVRMDMQRKLASGVVDFFNEYDAVPTSNLDSLVRSALSGLDVEFVDLNYRLCADGVRCLTQGPMGGLYNYKSHLSYLGAELFVDDIFNKIH